MSASTNKAWKTESKVHQVGRDKVVRLRFKVSDATSGEALQFGDDLVYLHGGYGGAFPKVERALEGGRIGQRLEVNLSPAEGYGERRPELVIDVPGERFAEERPIVGEAVDGELPDGRSLVFTVVASDADKFTLDGNHPFAGRFLRFVFEILDVRDAVEAERNAGFAFDGMLA